MDVVEVNSYYDPTGVTVPTAVRLIIDRLGVTSQQSPWIMLSCDKEQR